MFFYLSKMFWVVASPLNFIWFVLLIAVSISIFKKQKMNKVLFTGALLFLVLGAVPIGHNLTVFLETRYERPTNLPDKIDGIIVLGGGFHAELSHMTGMMVANGGVNRTIDFVELAQKYPEAKLVYSGGSGSIIYKDLGEAPIAKKFLKLMDIDEGRIIYEADSRNTHENVRNSKKLMSPQPNEQWIVVTSMSHIPRTMGIFAKQNWPVIAYPSSPKTNLKYILLPDGLNVLKSFSLLNAAVKEMIGCVIYYFSGKSAFILPPPALKSQE